MSEFITTRAISAFLLLCASFSAAARDAPSEFFDERSGATVTVVHEALTFSRVRLNVHDSDRDYVGLVAAQVDRSGHLQLYLIAYCWTRVDPRSLSQPDLAVPAGTLILTADNRQMQFLPIDEVPKELQDGRKLLNQGAFYTPLVYSVTLESLRAIAKSKDLLLSFGAGPEDAPADTFELWEGQQALRPFVELLESPGIG